MSRTPDPGHAPRVPDTAGTSSEVAVQADGRVRVVTLGRPQARNALSISLATELFAVLAAAAGVGAIVVRGADPAFCAGVDLEEAASGSAPAMLALKRLYAGAAATTVQPARDAGYRETRRTSPTGPGWSSAVWR